ncbi:hypothetical protein AGMMS50229_03050 [Campylobacterota bacterium]|nr:hypothetical protein AGMMS50229_03050 [Campylobacterota bacterium]
MKMLEIIIRVCAVYCAVLVFFVVYYAADEFALLLSMIFSMMFLSIWLFSSRKIYDDLMLQWKQKVKLSYIAYLIFGIALSCFGVKGVQTYSYEYDQTWNADKNQQK